MVLQKLPPDLFRHLASEDADGNQSIELIQIRSLTEGERDTIASAHQVFESFGPKWGFNNVVGQLNRTAAAWNSLFESMRLSSGIVNSHDVDNLKNALAGVSNALKSWTESDRVARTDEAIIKSEMATFVSATQLPPHNIQLTVDVSLKNAFLQIGGSAYPVADVADRLFTLAETLAIEEIAASDQVVQDAAKHLSAIDSEALYGHAVLADADLVSAGGSMAEPIPVLPPSYGSVLSALRDSHLKEKPSAASTESATAVYPAAEETNPSQELREAEPVVQSFAPLIDLATAASSARALAVEAEQDWSNNTLNNHPEQHHAVAGRWLMLINDIRTYVDARSNRREQTGAERILVDYPISMEAIEELCSEYNETEVATERILTTAQVSLMARLVEAMAGLQEPQGFRVDLVTNEELSWWSSGAFLAVETAATAVLEANERQFLIDHPEARSDKNGRSDALHALHSAQMAHASSLPEAAVTYCARVITLETGCTMIQIRDNFQQVSGSLHSYAESPRALQQLAACSLQIGQGANPTTDFLICLSSYWVRRIAEILLSSNERGPA